jgi:catalase
VTGAKVRENPASYSDHYSQPRQFWLSMSAVEQDHIIQAYTFELGKCYEQAIKERQLESLARIDERLCARVAAGLGLPAPQPTEPPVEVEPSAALTQLGRSWPVDGRVVGVVVDESSDLAQVAVVTEGLQAAGALPLVVAPAGGEVGPEGSAMTVQRTYLTTRSVEFDALVLTGSGAVARDALPHRDAKAGAPQVNRVDPRLVLLVTEAFRHAKGIGAIGPGAGLVEALGLDSQAPGIAAGDAADVVRELLAGLAAHRAWDRVPVSS